MEKLTAKVLKMPAEKGLKNKNHISNVGFNIIAIIIFFAVWIGYTTIIAPKGFLIPSPQQVVQAGIEKWNSGLLIEHIAASMFRVFTAFFLALVCGVLVGFFMGWYRIVRGLLEPFVQFFRMIPAIALIPLFVMYVGIGEPSKIIVIWLSAFLTITITVYQGIRDIDPKLIKAARVLGANNYAIFRHIAIPASFPYILIAARLGSAASWTTLVAAELIAASRGLGYMVTEAGIYFQPPVMYLGIFFIGAIGLSMDKLILFLEKKMTDWQEKVA